ncbi:sialate O-acetylesterase [Daejeonella sp.]|uniref:sialate O-acetylesterase n=1 Tax=Daejeonella sp. TaxID=2805397 RepID=UPI0030C2AB73
MGKLRISLIFAILVSVLSAQAKVTLPSVLGNNMVLQQKSQVALWGSAKSSAKVSIVTSWNNKTYSVTADSKGTWLVKVTTGTAGGPYSITISDGEKLILNNVLLGEVWVCSGQSNMGMALRGNSSPIINSNQIILTADNPSLRLFKVATATSLSPMTDTKGQWDESNSATAREFSALAFQFGQILQKKLKVPVGLIQSEVGGTMIEAWMSAESLKNFPEVKIPASLDTVKAPHKEPTTLFNGKIAPLLNYGIKGFIWLQGESNRHEPELYSRLFPAMVADWRKLWNQGELPFYYVQIAPFGSTDKTRSGVLLREAQLKASSIIPNSGMASAMDVGVENDIHFFDKTKPAERLAYLALAKTYGIQGIAYSGPVYKSMEIDGNKAILTFDFAGYLTSYRRPLTLFEIAGEDKKFHPALATISAGRITVRSDAVSTPVAVRYAWREWVVGELYNNDNLPASSFRTDNW